VSLRVGAVSAATVVLAVALGLAAHAAAAPCPAPARAWLAGCADAGDGAARYQPTVCDDGILVVQAGVTGAAPLSIELRASAGGGFRVVDGVALSPVVEVPDWDATPAAWRAALDQLAACVARERPPFGQPAGAAAAATSAEATRPGRLPGTPWLAAVGAVLLAGLLWLERRRLRAACAGRLWLLAVSVPSVVGVRALLHAAAFVHPNGQGPIWVGMALCDPSSYGPGYREMFGAIAARGGGHPEAAIFAAQAGLAALVPAAGFLLARLAGGGARLGLVVAALATLDPVAIRLAGSESYYALVGSLVVPAVLALVVGARARRWRLALGALAAGFLCAQAARIHPVAWAPVGLAPLAIAALPGRALSRRVLEAVGAGAIVGAVVAATSLATLRLVAAARLVDDYGSNSAGAVTGGGVPWMLLVGAGAVVASHRRWRRGLVAAAAIGVPLFVALRLASAAPWSALIWHAHLRLFLPVMLVGVAVALRGLRGPDPVRTWAPVVGALAVAAPLAASARALLTPTTDGIEQRWALGWRDRLGPDDTVVYLERAERRVLRLPLSTCVAAHPRLVMVQDAAVPTALPPGRVYYVETSLCSTVAGAPRCAALRALAPWQRLDGRTLPARTGDYQPYPTATLEVWLGVRPE